MNETVIRRVVVGESKITNELIQQWFLSKQILSSLLFPSSVRQKFVLSDQRDSCHKNPGTMLILQMKILYEKLWLIDFSVMQLKNSKLWVCLINFLYKK